MGDFITALIKEGELVTGLPEPGHVIIVVNREGLADEPFVVNVIKAVAAELDDLVAVEEETKVR